MPSQAYNTLKNTDIWYKCIFNIIYAFWGAYYAHIFIYLFAYCAYSWIFSTAFCCTFSAYFWHKIACSPLCIFKLILACFTRYYAFQSQSIYSNCCWHSTPVQLLLPAVSSYLSQLQSSSYASEHPKGRWYNLARLYPPMLDSGKCSSSWHVILVSLGLLYFMYLKNHSSTSSEAGRCNNAQSTWVCSFCTRAPRSLPRAVQRLLANKG